MASEVKVNCCALIKYEEESNLRVADFLETSNTLFLLAIPCYVYTALNVIITKFVSNNLLSMLLAFVSYVIYLSAIGIIFFRVRKNVENREDSGFEFDVLKLSGLYAVFLAINAIYFAASAIFKPDGVSALMAVINLVLYTGFAVSFKNLLEVEKYLDVLFCFFSPFSSAGFTLKKAIVVFLIIVALAFFSTLDRFPYAVAIFLVLLVGIGNFLAKKRNKALDKLGENLKPILKNKNVLLLQLGANNVVKKEIQKILCQLGKEMIVKADEIVSHEKYDVIIVLNTICRKANYARDIKQINSVLKKKGFVVDPFVTKRKKRCFFAAWWGIPSPALHHFTAQQYLKALGIR